MSYYQNKRKRQTPGDWILDNFEAFIGILLAIAVVGIIAFYAWATSQWVDTKESLTHCTVNNKESVSKDKTHEYRVYTDECGVLTVKDEAWLGLYNSADTYGKIKVGDRYAFDTVGWRNGFFGSFQNIVKVVEDK